MEGERPIRRMLHILEDALLVVAFLVLAGLAFAQIVLRNVAATGVAWADPLLRYLVLWIGLLGAMVAAREDRHITIDAVSYFLPPRTKCGVRVVTDAFTAGVCVVLARAAFHFVSGEKVAGATAFGFVPYWAAELILPLSFSVLAIRYGILAAVHLRRALSGLERPTTTPGPLA